jgi:2-amino-4-hydroxy-6-hydroxymethyldihydropteridine diphosphokinase
MKAWLCLGSNQDNPFQQLEKAMKYLEEKCYIKILQKGRVTTTKAWGYEDQPDFANQIIEIETPLSAQELLIFLKSTEADLGRQPTFKWGPRTIDLDILFYENQVIREGELRIPHAGITEREYLINLLNEMIPDYVHPGLNQTIKTIYANFQKRGGTQ